MEEVGDEALGQFSNLVKLMSCTIRYVIFVRNGVILSQITMFSLFYPGSLVRTKSSLVRTKLHNVSSMGQ